MPTRADYYIRTGPSAEWLGSTTYDGYPGGTPQPAIGATDESSFRVLVEQVLATATPDSTSPKDGWPWPWNDSRTTDYAYAWTPDGVRLSSFGRDWESFDAHNQRVLKDAPEPRQLRDDEVVDMSARKADAATVLAKSGLILGI